MSNNFGITTLSATIHQTFDTGDEKSCFEGNLLIPGTSFQVKFLSQDPDFNACTEFFKIDNYKVIGSNVGVNDVETALNLSLLLEPIDAFITPQKIVIDGTFDLDFQYYFGTLFSKQVNEIIMKPDAKLNIKDDITFFRTNILGCSDKWDKIDVYYSYSLKVDKSSISGAKVAIELNDNTDTKITNTVFNNNDTGIGAFGESEKDIKSIMGNVGIRNGMEGIHFEHVKSIENSGYIKVSNMINDGVFIDHTNLIISKLNTLNCNNGIRVNSRNSLLNVTNSVFDGMGNGIGIWGLEGNELLQVTNDNVFKNLTTGIVSINGINDNIKIANSTFENTISELNSGVYFIKTNKGYAVKKLFVIK